MRASTPPARRGRRAATLREAEMASTCEWCTPGHRPCKRTLITVGILYLSPRDTFENEAEASHVQGRGTRGAFREAACWDGE